MTLFDGATLALGFFFGLVAQQSRFCLTGGLREQLLHHNGQRLRAFALAMAVALMATQLLEAITPVSLEPSLYRQSGFSWLLIPLGGLLFGYGMLMANGCGARSLVLLASGNLRSFVVLVCLALAAAMTLTGLLAPIRLWLSGFTTLRLENPGVDGLLQAMNIPHAQWIVSLLMAAPLLAYSLGCKSFRHSSRHWLGGLLIGLTIPAGWWITGYLGANDFEPVPLASFTFVAPVNQSLQYLMLATGMTADFAILSIAGVFLGALVGAVLGREFSLRSFESRRQLVRAMVGGFLMGTGGALALGCSIGQGLSGYSTLSLPSLLAIGGILTGGAAALRGPLSLSVVG